MNKPVYLCDPEKNELCSKEGCYILGGPCKHTTDKAYEKKQTNQDKIAEIVRTMDSERLAEIISEEVICLPDSCPAWDFCTEHEHSDITCRTVFEKWLKEETDGI